MLRYVCGVPSRCRTETGQLTQATVRATHPQELAAKTADPECKALSTVPYSRVPSVERPIGREFLAARAPRGVASYAVTSLRRKTVIAAAIATTR